MTKRWTDERDLAAKIRAALARGVMRIVLTRDTAHIVAARLEVAGAMPTRDEIARMVCGGRICPSLCYGCLGTANVIVNAYGQRLERPIPAAPSDDRTAP